MSELGNLLRKAREQRGYSLDDIQEITKIRKRYLEAIEEGDYGVLPGNFYARAFVKNYAETVGLDAEEVFRLYQREIPSPYEEEQTEMPVVRKRRRSSVRSSDRWSKWGFRVLMWSFLLLIGAVIYTYAINYHEGSDKRPADNETPLTDNVEPDPADADDPAAGGPEAGADDEPDEPEEPVVEQEETTLEFVEKSGNVERYSIRPGATHTYEVTVEDGKRSWVEIRTGGRNGEKIHYKEERGPAVITYELTGPVFLNIGSTRSVDIRISGVQLPDGDVDVRRFLVEPAEEDGAESAQP